MVIFHTDLDNTLIYSYKHEIGNDKICVEIYQGREISFMTEKSYGLLKKVREKVLVVPTTTRTIEQYQRIDLGIGVLSYALVCNGGVLLIDGKEDEQWYKESLELVADCQQEFLKAQEWFAQDKARCFEIRNIKDLFLFTKSEKPEQSVEQLKARLNLQLVEVFHNGIKVYVVPKKLSKGMAVKRFRQRINGDTIIAAGDSEFDISMLEEADIAIAPEELLKAYRHGILEDAIVIEEKEIFSDELLEYIIQTSHLKNL